MELNKISKEELEQMSYADLSYIILKENKKPINTANLFKKICDMLGYSDSEYSEKIGDFYTLLTTDKRFLFLDSSEWDLRENNIVKVELEDEDDVLEEAEDIEEIEEDMDEEIEEDIDEDIDDSLDDDSVSEKQINDELLKIKNQMGI